MGRKPTHGHTKFGGYKSPTYCTWFSMKYRCKKDERYSKRGITVCEEWNNFENFLKDMGERPEGMSLDRIENDKGYYKENCRWATPLEQSLNRRNVFYEFQGV